MAECGLAANWAPADQALGRRPERGIGATNRIGCPIRRPPADIARWRRLPPRTGQERLPSLLLRTALPNRRLAAVPAGKSQPGGALHRAQLHAASGKITMKVQESEEPYGLAQYRDIATRRRWWILGTLFAVWAAAWVAVWMLPYRYRSETTIIIDELQVPAESGSGLQERLQTLTPQILSRARLQRIIQDLKLYGGAGHPSTEALVNQMRRDIKVQPLPVSGRPNELAAFTVSYSAASPALAQQVTTRLTSLFIEDNVRTRAQRSQQATSFLENQLQDARAWLQKQESRLQQFKAQYQGQLPSETQANLSLRDGLENRLQNASQELQRANQQKL